MYSKGREVLLNIDRTLASLREGARQESRGVTFEDLLQLTKSQQEAKGREQSLTHRSSQGLNVSDAARIMATSKSVGVDSEMTSGIPPWYEGQYTPAESSVNNNNHHHHHLNNNNNNSKKKISNNTKNKKPEAVTRDKKQNSIEKEVEEDVAERVSQAERTLYPLLLAAVADYSVEREGAAVGHSSSDSNNNVVVVEWDEHGAPRRLRSTWIPNTPPPTSAIREVRSGPSERVESSNSNSHSNSSKRNERLAVTAERTKTISMGSTTKPLDFNEACNQLYEYNPKHNPLKSIVLGSQDNFKESHSLHSRGHGIRSTRGNITNGRRTSTSSGTGSTGSGNTNRNKKPQLSTEGIVIPESSASGLAKKIRRAVLEQQQMNMHEDDEKRNSSRVSLERKGDIGEGIPIPITPSEQEEEVVFFTEVVMPVTAFFCSGCSACTPRDVSTGLPDKCPSCGEAFGEMPETLQSAATPQGPVEKNEQNSKKRTTSTATATTGTTTDTNTVNIATGTTTITNDAGTSTLDDNGNADAVETRVGTSSNLLSLDETVHGLYFLHLWDQIASGV
ncbi:uncharacterized protein TM35_000181370 [Trypanosoma theileri]|uniref:Uncharacterized protein n=1 Tax=Trypanosoma theileri TaxID=67003 RepID=A0A1X0NVD9_9TRYP|nr:uncharacterized protein TM35_000181370 [Trypanosoma theileri]ORC88080.1 hypothetical protein TM35_000181370 [Trypanosoma theileri]